MKLFTPYQRGTIGDFQTQFSLGARSIVELLDKVDDDENEIIIKTEEGKYY